MISIAAALLSLVASTSVSLPPADAPAARSAPNGEVAGFTRVSMEGRRLACRGVLLIPDSPGVAAQIAQVFGNTERGTRLVGEREAMRRARRDRDVELVAGARESRCGFYVRSFEFENVPPGDYYVTAYFAPGMAMGDPAVGMIPTGLDLMRRITVPAGRRAEVSFVHR